MQLHEGGQSWCETAVVMRAERGVIEVSDQTNRDNLFQRGPVFRYVETMVIMRREAAPQKEM